jgi:hypothetical protein
VDTPTNDFDHWFAPWPLRFYVVHRGRMKFIAQPHQASYDVTEVPSHTSPPCRPLIVQSLSGASAASTGVSATVCTADVSHCPQGHSTPQRLASAENQRRSEVQRPENAAKAPNT